MVILCIHNLKEAWFEIKTFERNSSSWNFSSLNSPVDAVNNIYNFNYTSIHHNFSWLSHRNWMSSLTGRAVSLMWRFTWPSVMAKVAVNVRITRLFFQKERYDTAWRPAVVRYLTSGKHKISSTYNMQAVYN